MFSWTSNDHSRMYHTHIDQLSITTASIVSNKYNCSITATTTSTTFRRQSQQALHSDTTIIHHKYWSQQVPVVTFIHLYPTNIVCSEKAQHSYVTKIGCTKYSSTTLIHNKHASTTTNVLI